MQGTKKEQTFNAENEGDFRNSLFPSHASHCGLLKMFLIADILEITFECPLNGGFLDTPRSSHVGSPKLLMSVNIPVNFSVF